MILDRLSSYLQNQPYSTNQTQAAEKAAPSVLNKDTPDEQIPEELHLSNRAEYLEYLSREYDVTALNQDQLNDLQGKLRDYGFISNNDVNGMRSLALAKQLTNGDDTINAVEMLDRFKNQFDEFQIPYSMRQQVDKMSVVIQNLASARTLPAR